MSIEIKKKCCLNSENLVETMRREEVIGTFVWLKCKVCNQVMLTSLQKKNSYESREREKAKRTPL